MVSVTPPPSPSQLGDLTEAAALGDLSSVRENLKNGADINENVGSSEEALTPVLAALAEGHDDVATYLISQGASLQPTFRGFSARDFAEHKGQESLSEVIRKRE